VRIKEIQFDRYKGFHSSGPKRILQRLQISPLTFIFGKNNSGKSTVARLPLLILGGLECSDSRLLPLEVKGQVYGANFLDIAAGGDFFEKPKFIVCAEDQIERLQIEAELYIPSALSGDEPPKMWSYRMIAPESFEQGNPDHLRGHTTQFSGLLPAGSQWDKWRRAAAIAIDQMVHLGPVRHQISPSYPNDNFVSMDRFGLGTAQLLRMESDVAESVGAWFDSNLDGAKIALQKDSSSFSIRVFGRSRQSVNLAHSGEGLQQVLPIVTHQVWRQKNKDLEFLDIVEQPELHLHPAAQAPLADLYIATALATKGCTIVETNSEGVLLRLQRRVAEKVISPDKLAVYFVDIQPGGSSELRRINIQEDGQLEWWPQGVFEEDFLEVAAIRRAQRADRIDGTSL